MGGGSVGEDEHSEDGCSKDGHDKEECMGKRHVGEEGAARALSAASQGCIPGTTCCGTSST